ncbi:hypothetical protein HYALB_00000443 [Hymenoscyphus albidus]|uniref:Peptidase S1 domain-containing protein n=1 Tax=Hymenoscyphus albidus TaxID=595503 RepID=A0A9N9LM51_9HELO|nr:hypothetical protein HYALB_00000443 [Hymenoscyphus albidus]
MAPKMTLAIALAIAAFVPATLAAPTEIVARQESEPELNPIVGGVAAAAGEFPYIVSLSSGGSHFCGGVLINSRTVVTAAHCSEQSASSVRVRVGTVTHASGGTQVGVSRIISHPNYNPSTTDADIAVWQLATAIPTSSTVGYATLPAQGSDPAAGTTVTVAGWGTLTETANGLPARLQKVDVNVIARNTCAADYSGYTISNNMFCAGVNGGGKDSCGGDSGGPIVDASSKTLYGVVSWGVGCARPDFPGVYTRVGNYVNWINSNSAA